MTRLMRALFAVVVVAGALVAGVPAPAAANAGAEADFIERVNAARSSRGIPRLAVDGELTSIGRRWSQRMASDQRLSHNPNLAKEVTHDWEKLAENVGTGGDVESIHTAFMDSASHRANILDSALTHIGVGVVVDGSGQIWVTEVFMRLRGGSSSPTTTATPTTRGPAAAPAPAPAPTPTTTTTAARPRTVTTTAAAPRPPAPATTTPPAAVASAPAEGAADAGALPADAPAPAAASARLVLVLSGLRALDRGR